MKNKRIIFLFVALVFCMPIFGQQITDLRLNEMLIKNDSNYVDEYGRHVPWIEVFNTAYNSVNISGCFLTDDTTGLGSGEGNPNWYRIPKGDPLTLITQRDFVIFYLDNSPLYGTFHVNFDPNTSKSNYVALISSNGKFLIDMIEYPASLRNSDKSYGCLTDGIKEVKDESGKMVSNLSSLEYFTPGSTNKVELDLSKSEILLQTDKYGIGLALISMAVVFFVLILIYGMLKIFGKVATRKAKKATAATAATAVTSQKDSKDAEDHTIKGEELAAITLALHLHMTSLHDEESEIITIDSPSAHYSPWAQKHLVIKRVQHKRS